MKRTHPLYALLLGGLCLGLGACSVKKKATPTGLTSERDTVAYAFGMIISESFSESTEQMPGDPLDRELVIQGFADAIRRQQTKLSSDEAKTRFAGYFHRLREEQAEAQLVIADSVLKANQSKEGVKVTESGLQYRVLRGSQGPRPTAQDTVVVHYTGRLASGKVFDSSYERREPATFPLGDVIRGWTEGITLMTRGAKYEFLIPPSLAYGSRAVGGMIPANSPLFFEVELLEIKPYQAPAEVTAQEEQPSVQPETTVKVKKKTSRRRR